MAKKKKKPAAKKRPDKRASFRELVRGIKAKHRASKKRKKPMARSREEEEEDRKKAAQKRKEAKNPDDPEASDPALADVDLSQPPADVSSPAPNPESAPGGDVVGLPPKEYAEQERAEAEADQKKREEADAAAKRRS